MREVQSRAQENTNNKYLNENLDMQEANNVANVHSFKYSGLVNCKVFIQE